MSKHLTLSDRAIIEKYLAQDMPFSYIAKRLHRSPSTISREVKNHRCFVNGYRYSDNPCINYRSCIRRNLCDGRNLSIPAITDARIALNLIAINYVLSLFHLIAKHYLNHLMFVLDVLMRKSVNVITLITLHIVLMLNIANSYTMLVLALEQVLNVLWN